MDETDGQLTFIMSNSGYKTELSIGTAIFRKQLFFDGTFDEFIEALELRQNYKLTVANCNLESIKNILQISDGKLKIITGVYTDFSGASGVETSTHGIHHFDQKIEIPLNSDDNVNKLLNVFAILKMFQPEINENDANSKSDLADSADSDDDYCPDDFDYENYD